MILGGKSARTVRLSNARTQPANFSCQNDPIQYQRKYSSIFHGNTKRSAFFTPTTTDPDTLVRAISASFAGAGRSSSSVVSRALIEAHVHRPQTSRVKTIHGRPRTIQKKWGISHGTRSACSTPSTTDPDPLVRTRSVSFAGAGRSSSSVALTRFD